MNNLERFIRTNRGAFDNREPSSQVWSQIRRSLDVKSGWINALPFWRAAAVLFMAITAYLLTQNLVETAAEKSTIGEFQDVEAFYTDQIASKIELIEAEQSLEGPLNGFTHDFHQLEAMYQVLKEELRTRPSKKVKDALVLNLLIRIDLLNQQLHKLEKSRLPEVDEGNASV